MSESTTGLSGRIWLLAPLCFRYAVYHLFTFHFISFHFVSYHLSYIPQTNFYTDNSNLG